MPGSETTISSSSTFTKSVVHGSGVGWYLNDERSLWWILSGLHEGSKCFLRAWRSFAVQLSEPIMARKLIDVDPERCKRSTCRHDSGKTLQQLATVESCVHASKQSARPVPANENNPKAALALIFGMQMSMTPAVANRPLQLAKTIEKID